MSILKRFKSIMASNINSMLDKAENPAKMVDQILRDLNEDLAKVKSETSVVMAQQQRAKREMDECNLQIQKMQNYAVKAVELGNDNDAKQFLSKKSQFLSKLESLQKNYEISSENASKMKQMYDKLVSQIDELKLKRDSIKATVAVAKTQQKLNQMVSNVNRANDGIDVFDAMEQKANRMLDEANAFAQLNGDDNSIDELVRKYDSPTDTVEDELEALKRQMGKSN